MLVTKCPRQYAIWLANSAEDVHCFRGGKQGPEPAGCSSILKAQRYPTSGRIRRKDLLAVDRTAVVNSAAHFDEIAHEVLVFTEFITHLARFPQSFLTLRVSPKLHGRQIVIFCSCCLCGCQFFTGETCFHSRFRIAELLIMAGPSGAASQYKKLCYDEMYSGTRCTREHS